MLCPLCNYGEVIEHKKEVVLERGRTIYAVPMRFGLCNSCQYEFVSAEQSVANKLAVQNAEVMCLT